MSTRKSNGDGSIRQRSDGRWEGRYTAPDGRQKSVYGKTKSACRDALRRRQAEIITGVYAEYSKMSVGEWLDTWLSTYCGHVKPTTLRNYRCYVNTYFKPYLGRIPLAKLQPIHLQGMFNTLAEDLAPSSVKSVRIALSSALGRAVKFDLIPSNPCAKVTLARPAPRDMTIVDRQLFPAFVQAARATRCGAALILLIQTGIRSGELRGLRWSDVDLEAGTLTVSRQLSFDGKRYIIQTPKTGKSRPITLMPDTVDLLKRHHARQAEARLASGRWIDDDLTADLVFRKPSGGHYTRTTLMGPAKQVGQAIGLPGLHPHDLRHSYAVAALRSGIDVKTVQNNLGHASATMTLDIYAAYTDDMGRAAAQKLQAYWESSN